MSAASAMRLQSRSRRAPSVVIVGAGFGGIAAAIELRRHGIEQITIVDRAPELGGTWFYNSYPGAACDVPSHLYSFSFAQRRDWTRLCSPQSEIHDYLRAVAREHDVERHVQLGKTVTGCDWDEASARWRVETDDGARCDADVLVLATGQLHQPAHPPIAGAETFAGHSFHSARWDHDYALAGKRVAVIGSGASAVQFIPDVAERARSLSVFQRTGNWFLPRRNRELPARGSLGDRTRPGLQRFRRRFMFEYCEADHARDPPSANGRSDRRGCARPRSCARS